MTCKRSEVLCESGYADPKEGTQDVETCQLQLLGKVLLDREDKFFKRKNQKGVLSTEVRERTYDDDHGTQEGGEKPGQRSRPLCKTLADEGADEMGYA